MGKAQGGFKQFSRLYIVQLDGFISRNPEASFENATAITHLDQVPADAVICGGAAVYDLLISQCDEVLVTTVKKEVEGDTFFNFQWLEGFTATETLEETDEYSIISYRR